MPTDCVEWIGSRNIKNGNRLDYGQVRHKGKMQKAHRVAWELKNGPIPNGMLVLHRCDNPPCVNVDHLFLGSHKDNAIDREQKGRGKNSVGTNNPKANISEMTAVRLKMLDGVLSASAAARSLGVSVHATWSAMKNKSWRHVNSMTRYAV